MKMNNIKNKLKIKLLKILDWAQKIKKDFLEIIQKDYFMENPFPSIINYYLTKDRS
jgi:hypothetical protein